MCYTKPIMNWGKTAQWLIEKSFLLLFFLVPLIMTPWNYELFEYNKMMLTYALTTVIVGSWIVKMIVRQKFLLQRTFFDIPLVVFFTSQLLSTLFSLDVHTSFWGYYSRFHGGLLSTIAYLFLYWAFVTNIEKKDVLGLFKWALYSLTIVTFYGLLESFGIDAKYWVQDVQNRVFSTLGQPNWLSAYIAAMLPIPLAFTLQNRKNKALLVFYLAAFAFALICTFFTKSRSGIPATLISLFSFLLLATLPRIFSFRKSLLKIAFSTLAILIIVGGLLGFKIFWAKFGTDIAYIFGFTDQVKITMHTPFKGATAYGSSSGDIRKIVWRGAVDIFKRYPVFGSGVETFAYSYYGSRPVQHNLLSEWDFLYNKAHNEYFNFAATTGTVGIVSHFLLIGWIIFWFGRQLWRQINQANQTLPAQKMTNTQIRAFQDSQKDSLALYYLLAAFLAGWLSILVTNFFGFSVVPVALCFFLFPALALVLVSQTNNALPPANPASTGSVSYGLMIVVLLIGGYFLLRLGQMWQADTSYAAGNRLNKQGEFGYAYNSLQTAISLNPGEPIYRDELAWSAANLAYYFYLQKDNANAQNMTNLALASTEKALKTSPKNLNFYKTRTKVYFKLAMIDSQFLQPAYQTLLEARKLAPTDPKLSYNLGLVLLTFSQNQEAAKTFAETVAMKANYAEARYQLALLYQQQGKLREAVDMMEVAAYYGGSTIPDAGLKLEEWKKN